MADQSLPTENRIQLAIKDYQQGQFKSIRQATATYDVSHQILSNRLRSVQSRRDTDIKKQKLLIVEELALEQ